MGFARVRGDVPEAVTSTIAIPGGRVGNPTSKWCAALLPLALAVSLPAVARQYEMVVPGYQPLLTSDGQVPTAARVKAAILDAANIRHWEVAASEPGRLTLRYAPRTHEVIIAVRYDDRGYRIEYVSSKEMDYETKKGVAYIHGNYNVWVQNLGDYIAASRILLPEDERGIVPEELLSPVPLSHLEITGPVRVHAAMPYRPGLIVRDAVRTECGWNGDFATRVSNASRGMVEVVEGDLDAAPGYVLKLSVVNMRDGKPSWAVVRADLYDNGRLIGRSDLRRTTTSFLSSTCGRLDDIGEALADDTVEWLRRGQFEVKLNPADTLPEIGEAENVPSIQ